MCLILTTANPQLELRAHTLTRLELTASYAVIRHNIRTYESGGVVEVVRGKQHAESALRILKECQPSVDHQEGWRYFFEKTDLKPGTDPAEATSLRQANLELRESQASQEIDALPRPSSPIRR